MGKQALVKLMYGSSEGNADLYYLGRVKVPDAFMGLKRGKRVVGMVSQLEYTRVLKEGEFDEVVCFSDLREGMKGEGIKGVKMSDMVGYYLKREGIGAVEVSEEFPLGMGDELRRGGIEVVVKEGVFLEERMVKRKWEVEEIRKANGVCGKGFALVERVLRESRVGKGCGRLYYKGQLLRSEWLRGEIEKVCLEEGYKGDDVIVAGGDKACDPHCRGEGVLRGRELIIVDIFPRSQTSGYFGDMTRTFLKGEPSEAQERLVKAVKEAQKRAIGMIRAGVEGKTVHEGVVEYFKGEGYKTGKRGEVYEGFFHSTGHGLGLEVHEEPRLGANGGELKAGMVVTVEPGLYYPGVGGCRIEDVVCVKKGGCEVVSAYAYDWIF